MSLQNLKLVSPPPPLLFIMSWNDVFLLLKMVKSVKVERLITYMGQWQMKLSNNKNKNNINIIHITLNLSIVNIQLFISLY